MCIHASILCVCVRMRVSVCVCVCASVSTCMYVCVRAHMKRHEVPEWYNGHNGCRTAGTGRMGRIVRVSTGWCMRGRGRGGGRGRGRGGGRGRGRGGGRGGGGAEEAAWVYTSQYYLHRPVSRPRCWSKGALSHLCGPSRRACGALVVWLTG